MVPRVLIVGVDWIGDVLYACARALRSLGVDVRVVVTNEHGRHGAQICDLQRRLRKIPRVGARLAASLDPVVRESLFQDLEQRLAGELSTWNPTVLLALIDGWFRVFPRVLADFPHVFKIGWMMDDPFFHASGNAFDLASFDRLYTVESSLVAPLHAATGRPVSNLPLGADHEVFRPMAGGRDTRGIVFVGKSYRDQPVGLARTALLSRAAPLGLEIWGDEGWKTLEAGGVQFGRYYRGGPINAEDANRVYNECEMAVCIHHPQIREGTSLRAFAICAAGAFQLVEWRPGLEQLLEPGREVVTFRCADELIACIHRYRACAEERRQIAAAGLARVRAAHTYVHRLRHMMQECERLPVTPS